MVQLCQSITTDGITPAHAGKRYFYVLGDVNKRDHPRTRGEKLSVPSSKRPLTGSPPHTRGKVCSTRCRASSQGITPAHAGKSKFLHGLSLSYRDHPRTRGEKVQNGKISDYTIGSPPHTRGKGSNGAYSNRSRRITPAHAGKSLNGKSNLYQYQDHPRTRGEKILLPWFCPFDMRITPAHAGKRSWSS